MGSMWIDERGSEVLNLGECRRLLAMAAKQGRPGHLGIAQDGAPLVLPVNYMVDGPDPVMRIGEGLMERVQRAALVALEVDDPDDQRPWSVLVRGLAIEESGSPVWADALVPRVTEPGGRMVRIRADVVTGRRLGAAPATTPAKTAASQLRS